MSTERIVITPYTDASADARSPGLKMVIGKYLFHWPLFLIGVVLALALAWVYNMYASPAYTITAKLLITDEKKESPLETAMQKMDVFEASKVVDNESEILQSRKLTARVVKELNLNITYKQPGGIKEKDIYQFTPVRLTVLKQLKDSINQSFSIYIKNKSHFLIRGRNGTDKELAFGQRLKNNFGIWRLDTTANISKFAGKFISISVQDTERTIDQYVGKIKSNRLNKLASVIELSLQDNVLRRGQDILTKTIDDYNDESNTEKKRLAEGALNFLDGRLADVNGDLSKVEKDFEGYKSSNGIVDVSSQSNLYLDNVKTNDNQLNDVNVQLNVIAGIAHYVNSSLSVNSAPATIGISDPGLTALIKQLMELQIQRDKMLATTPEENPIFEPVNQQIRSVKTSILSNIRGIQASLLTSKQQLDANNNRFESSIKNIPGQERQLVDIKRQQTNKENLYVYLLQKREEAALSYASNNNDSRLIDYNYTQSSSKRIVYAVAFMLGIFLPLGIVYGRDYLNDRVNTVKDIEDKTTVPILGELTYHEADKLLVVGGNNDTYEIGEQFRHLRTNLQLLHDNNRHEGKVTLLTSSIANEGKSFITSNLGATLAAAGRKTIILELDMRKPQIYKNFGLPGSHKGLSDLINGDACFEDIIQSSVNNENLHFITAGTLSNNPSEMLEQEELDVLISCLRKEYDHILIDSPPVNVVTDALILSRVSDVTLLVIRQGFTKAWELDVTEKLFKAHKLPKMNIVFNGIRKDRYNHTYNHNYAQYGYSQNGPEKPSASLTLKSFLRRF